jgi:hypothetical protein
MAFYVWHMRYQPELERTEHEIRMDFQNTEIRTAPRTLFFQLSSCIVFIL